MLVLCVRTSADSDDKLFIAGRTDSIITDFLPDETRIAFEGQERLCDQLVSASLVPARSCYLEFWAFQLSGVQDELAHQGFDLQACGKCMNSSFSPCFLLDVCFINARAHGPWNSGKAYPRAVVRAIEGGNTMCSRSS